MNACMCLSVCLPTCLVAPILVLVLILVHIVRISKYEDSDSNWCTDTEHVKQY